MLCDGPRRYPLPMNPARARGLIGACQTSPRAYGILWPDGSHSKSPRVHGLFLYSSTPRASATVPVHGPPRYRSTLPRTSDVALNSCGPATTTSPIPTPTPHVLECGVELDEEVQPGATVSAFSSSTRQAVAAVSTVSATAIPSVSVFASSQLTGWTALVQGRSGLHLWPLSPASRLSNCCHSSSVDSCARLREISRQGRIPIMKFQL